MIKKLRFKFVAIAMLSLFAVLAVIIAAVNVVSYNSIVHSADEVLSLLSSGEGRFPLRDGPMIPGEPFPGDRFAEARPELRYESRFFSVLIDESGAVTATDTDFIAAVDKNTAADMAQRVFSSGKASGFTGNYRYHVFPDGSSTRIIFLDCTRDLSTFRRFLLISCGISLAGLAAVFVLIMLLSGYIVRPVSESYEKQKRFITDAGHEIKTPITIIDADAEVLEMDMPDNEWLQDIRKQVKRLSSLTNDLIYLSRMEEERPQLQSIDFPLSDVVAETAGSFAAPAVTQNKTLHTDIQPMLTKHGDEKAVRQLVSILLDNALKYSPENSRIDLTLKQQGKTVVMTISNETLEDISKENLSHMFDRFYRVDPARHSHGYGIGLSIAKAIVNAHKGKIAATATDNSTLTITVILPL